MEHAVKVESRLSEIFSSVFWNRHLRHWMKSKLQYKLATTYRSVLSFGGGGIIGREGGKLLTSRGLLRLFKFWIVGSSIEKVSIYKSIKPVNGRISANFNFTIWQHCPRGTHRPGYWRSSCFLWGVLLLFESFNFDSEEYMSMKDRSFSKTP